VPPAPKKRLAVLTCMDARIDPLALLGLELGDAHVLRNGGGIVTDDVLRSLEASRRIGSEDVVVIGHTDCGLGPGEEERVREAVGALGDSAAGGGRVTGYVLDTDTGELRQIV
jgi:carbonic anhydrase